MLEVLVEDVGPSLLFGTAQVARNPRDGQSAPQSGAWGNTRQQPQGGFGQQEGWGGTSQQSPQQPAQGGWGRRHRPGRTTRRICRNPSRTSNKPWTNSHHSDPIFSPRHVLTRVFWLSKDKFKCAIHSTPMTSRANAAPAAAVLPVTQLSPQKWCTPSPSGRNGPAFVAHDGLDPALVLKSEQVLGLHQAGHLFAIDPLGSGCSTVAMCGVVEFGSDATSAPDAVFSVENGLDLSGHQSVI